MDPREYIFLCIILYIWYVQLVMDHECIHALLIRTSGHRHILARPGNIAHAVLCRWNNVLA